MTVTLLRKSRLILALELQRKKDIIRLNSPQIALSHSRALANPGVERGPSRKVRIKKLPKEKAQDKSTQTSKETKQTK